MMQPLGFCPETQEKNTALYSIITAPKKGTVQQFTQLNVGALATTTTTALKTSLKNEFASFQTLSRIYGFAQFVKCSRFFQELNS